LAEKRIKGRGLRKNLPTGGTGRLGGGRDGKVARKEIVLEI